MTWRQVDAPRWPVLSYEFPVQVKPSSGTSFHSLHATSQALQPMQTVGSVKKPTLTQSATYECRRWFVLLVPSPIILFCPLSRVRAKIFRRWARRVAVARDVNSLAARIAARGTQSNQEKPVRAANDQG